MKCVHDREKRNCPICSPEQVFRQYEYKAKQRGLSFSLSLGEFEKLVSAPCVFCGEQPSLGVDRKDSRIGYVSNTSLRNCQACCGFCNRLKSSIPESAFTAHVLKIAAHLEKWRKQERKTDLVVVASGIFSERENDPPAVAP